MWAKESGLRRGGRGDLGGEIIILGAQHRQKTPPAPASNSSTEQHPAPTPDDKLDKPVAILRRLQTSSPNALRARPIGAPLPSASHYTLPTRHTIAYPATRPRRRQFSLLLGSSFVVTANP